MRKIGIVPLYDTARSSLWMLPGYMDGISQAGGLPVMLPLTDDAAQLRALADDCDGFLFPGGQDVDPALYGAAASPHCGETCPPRDAMETALLREILHRDKPLLGICRGIQLLNAALGGTLYQDLPTEHPSRTTHHMTPPYDRAVHTVTVTAGSPLAALLGDSGFGGQQLSPSGRSDAVAPAAADGGVGGRAGGGGIRARVPVCVGGAVAPGAVVPRGCVQPGDFWGAGAGVRRACKRHYLIFPRDYPKSGQIGGFVGLRLQIQGVRSFLHAPERIPVVNLVFHPHSE